MAILTAPPTAPTTSDPTSFNSRADALIAWLATHVTEENALIAALAGTYTGASVTSLTPSVASKSFTASTGLAYQIGQPVMMASASNPAVWMSGPVTAYNSTTGAMTVNVTSIGTASAKADWIISLVPAGYTPGQIAGTATNDSATAGNIGEVQRSKIAAGSAVSLVSVTAKDVTTITITPGDWDVSGSIFFTGGTGTTALNWQGGINTSANTLPVAPDGNYAVIQASSAGVTLQGVTLPTDQWSVSVSTTLHLVAFSNFSGGVQTAYGVITARRAR
jgi:hypothetical protein